MTRRGPLLYLGAVVVLGAALVIAQPAAPRTDEEFRIDPAAGSLLGEMMTPGPAGFAPGFALEGGQILENHGVFTYRRAQPPARLVVEVHQRDTVTRPLVRTAEFALAAKEGEAPPEFVAAVGERLRAGESRWHWIAAANHPTPTGIRRLTGLQLPVVWFLLAQLPLWFGLALWRAARLLSSLPRAFKVALGVTWAVAIAVRLAWAPLRLVMLYIGYQLTEQAARLAPIPRYGAAAFAFDHLVLGLAPVDHRTLLWAHALVGVVTLPLVAALVQSLAGRPRATLLAAATWALLPAVIAHDDSEANTVVLLAWTVAGLVLVLDGLRNGRALSLVGAAALLGLAMCGRPEFPLVVPAAVVVCLVAARPPLRATVSAAWPLVLATALVVVPHLVHVAESAALLASDGSLPMGRYDHFFNRASITVPTFYPVALPLLALAGLWLPRHRRLVGALVVAGAFATVLTFADLDPANIQRVQVPAALLFVVAAALGADSLVAARPRFDGAAGVALAAAAIALTALPTVRAAFARTNEDEEEAFVRAALAEIKARPFVLVRLGYGDLSSGGAGSPVHLYFPDYLVDSRGGSARGITDWLHGHDDVPAYFYLGTRCYTPEQPVTVATARATFPMRAACADIVTQRGDGVVIERSAESHGDPLQTGFYGTSRAEPLRLALYRLRR